MDKKRSKGLVTQVLENLSRDIFVKYHKQINDLIASSPGIYALYNRNKLYYVGKSTDLRRRVKKHLKDKHLANWTHFSLYLVKKVDYIHDIESLVIRIANPKGNRVIPRGKKYKSLLKKLRRLIKEKQKEEFKKLFGERKHETKLIRKQKNLKSFDKLNKLINRKKGLYKQYKGKLYRATLYTTGIIKVKNKKFNSLSAAAKFITKKKVNGWRWWKIKDKNGKFLTISKYISKHV